MAIKRIYVHEDIAQEFRAHMIRFTASIQSGDGLTEDVFLGPVQNKAQYDKVKSFFLDVEENNWNVAVGNQPAKQTSGYFIYPTVIDQPPEDSRIMVEEPFGPIVPLLTWSIEDEVIQRANRTTFGLGASVWSDDLTEANRIARQLEAGSVWVNTHQEGDPMAPFGGHKQSGLGYEWGIGGLRSYCNVQSLFLKLPTN